MVFDGVPTSTWIFSLASLVVLIAAAVVHLSAAESPPRGAETSLPLDEPEVLEHDVAARSKLTAAGLAQHPLDISQALMGAQALAHQHLDRAALTSIDWIVEGGRAQEPLNVEFADLASVSSTRVASRARAIAIRVPHDGKAIAEELEPKLVRVIAEPNCPLQVAYGKLGDAGYPVKGRLGVLLAWSEKYDRSVWHITTEAGVTHHVDANSCAILRR